METPPTERAGKLHDVKENKKKIDRLSPGSCRVLGRPAGSTGSGRANSQAGFGLHPGRPGPGSTRRAGPGFKTMVNIMLKEKK